MHVHFLDPYRHRASPLHRLDPRVKFILALAFILVVALTPIGAWPVYILLFAIVLSIEILSDLGVAYVLKRAVLALPFVLAALPVIFTTQGAPLLEIPVGSWTLVITQEGLARFISIALKSWISSPGGYSPGSQHALPGFTGGHAGGQDPAPAGGCVWLDVAISVCAGRRSAAPDAGARRPLRADGSARHEAGRQAGLACPRGGWHGWQSVHARL